MAIVWPCSLSVDQYVAAGREIAVPPQDCPACKVQMGGWSGYRRTVRTEGHDHRIFVARARCALCGTTHALLPAFIALRRLDCAETIGKTITEVVVARRGVRPAAAVSGVPHTTARGWVRRFGARAGELAASFAGLVIELGGEALRPLSDASSFALAAMSAAYEAACSLPGWIAGGLWRFVSAVTGGRFISTNTDSPYLVVGKRSFMAPIPIHT